MDGEWVVIMPQPLYPQERAPWLIGMGAENIHPPPNRDFIPRPSLKSRYSQLHCPRTQPHTVFRKISKNA